MNKDFIESLSYINNSKVKDAMLYSLTAGGKRIRPKLFNSILKGFNIDNKEFDKISLAIEMIHTYSLIHDDLPAMDDDNLRRGKNTCHIEFDEATAILAGDALLTEAFYLISTCKIKSDILIKCINILSSLIGANGMIYGQYLDMYYEDKNIDFDSLKTLHNCKTGALISACLMLGCICCEKYEFLDVFKNVGYNIGLAFQIQDDILDYTSTSNILGKSNSDIKNNKSTSINVLGIDIARKHVDELYLKCKDDLNCIQNFDAKYLYEIINLLINRKK